MCYFSIHPEVVFLLDVLEFFINSAKIFEWKYRYLNMWILIWITGIHIYLTASTAITQFMLFTIFC